LASKAGTPASGRLVSELRDDLAKLRQCFYSECDDLPVNRQQEADARRFLTKARQALQMFAESGSSSNY
jgi:hypothetical protein